MQRKPHVLFLLAIVLSALAAGGCNKLKARDKLNKGVTAYKNGQFDIAIEDFKTAKELDPSLTNAQLYLATAYASQYIPGAPSPDNVRNGEQAVAEFKKILDDNPSDLSAIDGIGSILYNMGGTPFDANKMSEAKSYHEKHVQLSPSDPEPYYWVGVIDWAVCFRANRDLREDYNKAPKTKKQIKESDPMPPPVAAQFAEKYGSLADEGISRIQKAVELRPDYDDAMAYLNLLFRQKADMESTPAAREADLQKADDLVDKVKAIKQKKANMQPTQ